jgi:hypothetical protein
MIFTSETTLDLQQVVPHILATHIVLQAAIATEAVTQTRSWLVVTTSDLQRSKSSIFSNFAQYIDNTLLIGQTYDVVHRN